MNCIFCCVFNNEKYINMFYLLLESILLYGKLDNIQILIYTSTPFMNIIKNNYLFDDEIIIFEINDTYDNIDKSCKSRLDLFNLSSITKYEKILYLDTDIIVKNDINKVFDICKDDILYVLEEGLLTDNNNYYGGIELFGDEINNYSDKSAFTSGILLFNNCIQMKKLFNIIKQDIIDRPFIFNCFDQPYIVYNAFKYNIYNNKLLKDVAVNNDYNIDSNKTIHHFPGNPGIYKKKIRVMNEFLNKLNTIKNGIKIYNVKTPPQKNISFPLIGICVSYNYFDTLKFALPINYLHFDKIYIITQEDDIQTVEYCKKFDNVNVLFYDFKNNNKKFDKYGALNYAQKKVYEEYPESWYLIIDSDIILPNNFIDILNKENLNADCIYGAIRNNVDKSSELLDKIQIINNNNNWIYNNILHSKNTAPSILGCFQLYKKYVYHSTDMDNAGYGDYHFGYDNFKIFCNLENIYYFHLGPIAKNWNGKTEYFIDDINISLGDIYYKINKKNNNIYYDNKCQLVKYGNSKDIDYDIWTCSEQMRYDIYDFFKHNPEFKIAEIGAHKGYTTKILSNIFNTVYAVDNSIEWTNYNKNLNKNATNIEYVMLDLYKDNWEILPQDIEVSFIDAMHSYEGCKSDIMNSLSRFKNLKYIILDDYGVWEGVKRVVVELIQNKTLIFEKFIGIKNVPGPNGIVNNVNEGIICRVNNEKIQTGKIKPKQFTMINYNKNKVNTKRNFSMMKK